MLKYKSMGFDILQCGKEAFQKEINGLSSVMFSLDAHFEKAVELMLNCTGKIVICGIGKSALVGQKIVATLNSTGTPSQFLHAAEAIHGDLGLVRKDDVLLCITYSGTTAEIVQLWPYLKATGCPIISMTGNPLSLIAKEADAHLNVHIPEEACPNQLAPTSSTTAQLTMGDALAVALIEAKHFGKEDFAKFHPGGALGRNLTATVEQFLSEQRPEVHPHSDMKEVIISISSSRHGITVVTENQKILGVITDGDLRRLLLAKNEISSLSAAEMMSTHPKTIEKNALAKEAMAVLKAHNIGQLVVTENGNYIGILNLHHLLDAGIN